MKCNNTIAYVLLYISVTVGGLFLTMSVIRNLAVSVIEAVMTTVTTVARSQSVYSYIMLARVPKPLEN